MERALLEFVRGSTLASHLGDLSRAGITTLEQLKRLGETDVQQLHLPIGPKVQLRKKLRALQAAA